MWHFSGSYVRQLFKENTGENFNEYLIRKRMEKAGLLLQNTSMKIQDISQQCGYENQRYFASSFKKFYGCTPTEFKSIVTKEHLYLSLIHIWNTITRHGKALSFLNL